MGSLSYEKTLELHNEFKLHFLEIIRLNMTSLHRLKNNEITDCIAIVPEGVLKNNLHIYTHKEDICINICFGHDILTSISKNNVDTFIQKAMM
jgi:hypothetical protein